MSNIPKNNPTEFKSKKTLYFLLDETKSLAHAGTSKTDIFYSSPSSHRGHTDPCIFFFQKILFFTKKESIPYYGNLLRRGKHLAHHPRPG